MKQISLFILMFASSNIYATNSIIQFEQKKLGIFEKELKANITIKRSLSDSASVTVSFNIVSQTATAGTDYVDTSGSINWTNGDSTDKIIAIRIVEDFLKEGDETVWVILSGVTGSANLGSKDTLLLTIHDSYADIASSTNTDAIHKDNSSFKFWATGGMISRGYINISDTTATASGDNRASFGIIDSVFGKAAGNSFSIASLGDGGYAILTFDTPITNGIGPDFAIFENSFDETFLELAFVEVSSDGNNFYRFPAISNTPDNIQIGSFGSLDAKDLYNLAGKYKQGYGTPFDLEELKDSIGLDINRITHVKIVDVVGSIDSTFTSYDVKGNKVNDPFPTPFNSGGFDLEAVGIINALNATGISNKEQLSIARAYPNPFTNKLMIEIQNITKSKIRLSLINLYGQEVQNWSYDKFSNKSIIELDIKDLVPGIYFIKVAMQDRIELIRLIKKD